ncbi:MAG TPA: 5-oxoprolinase subunit PxpB [Chloroflexota bacterium]|nr:5-oxoprolinase subunit PxpB [Chloroflexota bacterium]
MARYLWCGDAAMTVEFGSEISLDLHRQVRAFAHAVLEAPPNGFLELVPTYRSATVHFDPRLVEPEQLEAQLRQVEARSGSIALEPGRLHVLPVHYGDRDGPDLEDVAQLHQLTPQQVVALHADREYVVYCVGFSPGFAFLGGLPVELHTQRLGTPRKLVPAGSVGIGGQQTGVYPVPTPGGWRLVGRTNFTFFDVNANPPCPIQAGDRIRFEAVEALEPGENACMAITAGHPIDPSLEVLKPGLFTTVQDFGRCGYQASGVSVSGAMDPLALRLANALVGNEPGAAALEVTLLGPTLRILRPVAVALHGAAAELRLNDAPASRGRALELKAGDELAIGRATVGARAYLAVAGGIDVPPVLGSRSTYTRGGFGGLQGRALQAGDVLAIGGGTSTPGLSSPTELPLPEGNELTVRVVLGPQDDYFSDAIIADFLDAPFEISTDADRMGYRLAGHALEHQGPAEIVSDGIVLGSVQVPPHGNPIVMLADRPSVGGYPKIATVISADVRLLAQCRPGMRVRFHQVAVPEARQALRAQEQSCLASDANYGGLPVDQVRALLAAMQRNGTVQAAIDTAGLRLSMSR